MVQNRMDLKLFAIGFMIGSLLLIVSHIVFAVPVIASNQMIDRDDNVVEIKSMMIPGGNMTFGSSLESANFILIDGSFNGSEEWGYQRGHHAAQHDRSSNKVA